MKKSLLSNYFSLLDYFSMPITFTIDKRPKSYTWFGLTFSIIIYILFIVMFFCIGKDFILKNKPNVLKFEEILDTASNLSINENSNLFIAIRLVDRGKKILKEFLKIENSDLFHQSKANDSSDKGCIKFFKEKILDISEYLCFYLIGNLSVNSFYKPENNLFANLNIYLSNDYKNSKDTINKYNGIGIDLLMPEISLVVNSYDINDSFLIKYKKVTDVLINRTVNREILLTEQFLNQDNGLIFENIEKLSSIGVIETNKYESSLIKDNNIYNINMGLSQTKITYSKRYKKFQEVIAESASIIYSILIIFKVIFYYPLEEMKKMQISKLITNVIEIEERNKSDKDLNADGEMKTKSHLELNNILDRINKFRSIKNINYEQVKEKKRADSTGRLKLEEESELENGRRPSNSGHSGISRDTEEIQNSKKIRSLNDNTNIKNSINRHKKELINSNFKILSFNPANKKLFNDKHAFNRINKVDGKNRRNSVDLLSLQIHSITHNSEVNESNSIPLKNIEERYEEMYSANKRMTNKMMNSNPDLSISNKIEFKVNTLINSSQLILNENMYGKFSFNYKEIWNIFICCNITKNKEKIKWSLYSLIKFYIEEKLDIVSYFQLMNELKNLKSTLLSPGQLLGLKYSNPFHIFVKSFDDSDLKNIYYYSKQNIDKLRSEFNLLKKEQKEKEINEMANYFSFNLYNHKMNECDRKILNGINDDGINLIIWKLNNLKEDLFNLKIRKLDKV